MLRPQSRVSIETPVDFVASMSSIPISYMLTVNDRAVPLKVLRGMVEAAIEGRKAASPTGSGGNVRVVEVEAGHSPMLSKPEECVRLIREAAGEKL